MVYTSGRKRGGIRTCYNKKKHSNGVRSTNEAERDHPHRPIRKKKETRYLSLSSEMTMVWHLLTFWLCPGMHWFKCSKPGKYWAGLLSHNWMVVGTWVSEKGRSEHCDWTLIKIWQCTIHISWRSQRRKRWPGRSCRSDVDKIGRWDSSIAFTIHFGKALNGWRGWGRESGYFR